MKGPIQSLELSYLVHATENAEKIEAAVSSQFGSLGKAKIDEMEGHFGNKITRVTYHVVGEEADEAFATVISKMGTDLKRRLRDELGMHMDEHSAFYLRLDKQGLLGGRLELTGSDPVRLRAKPRMHTLRRGAIQFFVEMLS